MSGTPKWIVETVSGQKIVEADGAETRAGDLLLFRGAAGTMPLNCALFGHGSWISCIPAPPDAPAGSVKMEQPKPALTNDQILFAATEGVPSTTASEPEGDA